MLRFYLALHKIPHKNKITAYIGIQPIKADDVFDGIFLCCPFSH